MLRIRCQKCGQHTEKIATVLIRKDAIPCGTCGARISLSTPTNKILIAEAAASCDRIGEALIKGLALADATSPAADAGRGSPHGGELRQAALLSLGGRLPKKLGYGQSL
jgi:DNA-directed RNA polymerase subunit RPC12/RpoP